MVPTKLVEEGNKDELFIHGAYVSPDGLFVTISYFGDSFFEYWSGYLQVKETLWIHSCIGTMFH